MDKNRFLQELRARLTGLPADALEERLSFYSEMIDDRIEDGASEEDAVAATGSVEDVAGQILSEIPISELVKEKVRRERSGRGIWSTVLIILGSPVWLPLLAAVLAVMLSVYVAVLAVVLSIWAVALSLAVSAVLGIAAAALRLIRGQFAQAFVYLGVAAILAGLSMMLYPVCRALTKGVLSLTAKAGLGIRNMIIGREVK